MGTTVKDDSYQCSQGKNKGSGYSRDRRNDNSRDDNEEKLNPIDTRLRLAGEGGGHGVQVK